MFFRLPWLRKKKPYHDHFEDTEVLELDYLVQEFDSAIADIQDPARDHIQSSLMSCQEPKDLWFLRGKVFNLISRHHCERVAHDRVARLDHKLHFFVEHHPDYDPEELPSRPMALLH